MNNNEFKIWMTLLDSPNKWLDAMEVAYLTNLTRLQASSILLSDRISGPNLEKDFDKSCRMPIIRIHGTPAELEELRQRVITRFYHIDESSKQKARNTLSSASWMTASDVAADTGMDRLTVSRTLAATDGIAVKRTKTGTMYLRVDGQTPINAH